MGLYWDYRGVAVPMCAVVDVSWPSSQPGAVPERPPWTRPMSNMFTCEVYIYIEITPRLKVICKSKPKLMGRALCVDL